MRQYYDYIKQLYEYFKTLKPGECIYCNTLREACDLETYLVEEGLKAGRDFTISPFNDKEFFKKRSLGA